MPDGVARTGATFRNVALPSTTEKATRQAFAKDQPQFNAKEERYHEPSGSYTTTQRTFGVQFAVQHRPHLSGAVDDHLQQSADQHLCSRNDRRIGNANDRPRGGPVREGRSVPVGESGFFHRSSRRSQGSRTARGVGPLA